MNNYICLNNNKTELTEKEAMFLLDISECLRTQNNRMTASPVFTIMKNKRVYGKDSNYADGYVFVYEYDRTETHETAEEVVKMWEEDGYDGFSEEKKETLEEIIDSKDKLQLEDFIEENGYYKCYYSYEEKLDNNAFYLTEKYLDKHIEQNNHHYHITKEPKHDEECSYTHVCSNWRNEEWDMLRSILMKIGNKK